MEHSARAHAGLPAASPRARPPDAPADGRERWFYACFALAIAVSIAISIFTYRSFQALAAGADAVERAQHLKTQLDALSYTITAAESRQRGYLLTRNPRFLDRYAGLVERLPALEQSLEAAAAADPALRPAVARLRALLAQKLGNIRSNLERLAPGRPPDQSVLEQGWSLMAALDAEIAGLQARQDRELVARAAELAATVTRNERLLTFGTGAAVLLLLLSGAIFAQGARTRARLQAEEHAARAVLQASEQRYRTLFESMDQGFCVLEMIHDDSGAPVDYRFVEVNPAFEQHTGLSNALGRTIRELVPDHDAHWFETYDRVARTGAPVRFENEARAMGRHYDVYAFAIGAGERRRVGVLFSDITARKQAEAAVQRLNTELRERADQLAAASLEARQASQAKSAFLATMSHEIRTPLAAVLGMVEVLARSELTGAQRRQLALIQQSASTLLHIIGDVLDFSKIEAGRIDLERSTLSLRRLLERSAALYRDVAGSKGLELRLECDAALAPAHVGDGVRLAQIVGNWLSNAIKFTERGSVTIRARVVDPLEGAQALAISVADTGIGIAPGQLTRLFEPFTQADAGTTRRHGGSGLGLAITRRLAELMGAQLRLDSAPGRGTVIELAITLPEGDPAALDPEPAAETLPLPLPLPPPATVAQARREGRLLLLAEDHPVIQLMLVQQLGLLGYLVEVAEDGAQALEKFRAGGHALVITDLHMPEMDGYQLVAAMREHERANGGSRTPVIALTANVQREEFARCLAAGMDDYLSKPASLQQLSQKLGQWAPARADVVPPAATAAPVPALDRARLDAYTGGDSRIARELLQGFCASTAADLDAIDAHCTQGDLVRAARDAHRIKGVAGMIGALDLEATAVRLETAARAGRTGEVAALAGDLRTAFARVLQTAAAPA